MVRKIAAIFFLTVLVLVQTPVQQFLKLPVLIAHFGEHRAENSGISFLEYIQLHYFSGNPKDDDYQRDMQLPFRETAVILLQSAVEIPEQLSVQLEAPVYQTPVFPVQKTPMVHSGHRLAIWQPPRAC
jgi:hypothetical protein